MNQVKRTAVVAGVACGAMLLAAWSDPVGVVPGYTPAEERACDFEIQARNTGTHDIYLDLYTSNVKNRDAFSSSPRQLKIQNARVGPNKILPPQRVTVNGKCSADRTWYIYWRANKDGATQRKRFDTGHSTRVSSSTGRRVLALGDVGKW